MENLKFEVGCRQCAEGGSWKIFADCNGNIRFAICGLCGHSVDIPNSTMSKEPDLKSYDLRMFS